MKKEVDMKKLCSNKKTKKTNKKSLLTRKKSCAPHTQKNADFHPKVIELFQKLAQIWKKSRKTSYTINSFKALMALYYGFDERNVNSRFNVLASLGILKVKLPSKFNKHGSAILDLEKLLEFIDDEEILEALMQQRKELKEQLDAEANAELEKLKNATVVKP